jgi:hypothetical protein
LDKALFKVGSLVRGFAKIPEGSSVKRAIHDGDTVSVVADGSFYQIFRSGYSRDKFWISKFR